MKFNSKQIKVLSSFFNDISKALMIAVVLGQGYIPSSHSYDKINANIFWFCLSILFVGFAIIINRQDEKS